MQIAAFFPLSSPLAHSEIICTILKALDRAAGPFQRFRGLYAFLKQRKKHEDPDASADASDTII